MKILRKTINLNTTDTRAARMPVYKDLDEVGSVHTFSKVVHVTVNRRKFVLCWNTGKSGEPVIHVFSVAK